MVNQELKKRWKTKDGQILLANIIKCLNNGTALSSINGLKKYSGRWDLRGALLSTIEKEKKIASAKHSILFTTGTLRIKNTKLESIDFSFGDISYSSWEKCDIENCLFEETIAKRIKFIACNVSGCVFTKTDFSYSYMNDNIGANSGSYSNCHFNQVNLSECVFRFPIIKNCVFDNCNLVATNFDGSRLINCKFLGIVNSAWFNGYSVTSPKSILGIFNRFNPKEYPNPMENVDYSDAKLIGVSFSNGINLAHCKFPVSDEYILIQNLKQTMERTKSFIELNWKDDDRRKGIALIEKIYYKQDKQYQQQDFIDIFPIPSDDLEFNAKFFVLIKKYNT